MPERSKRSTQSEVTSARGCLTLDQLGLKLPPSGNGDLPAEVKPRGSFSSVLDESHTSLTLQESCERAWFLGSGLAPGVDVAEQRLLRSLTSYMGGLGTVVHEGIRRVLDAHREKLNPEGRVLKSPVAYDFARITDSVLERFSFMEGDSWGECFPNGYADREHPRFREHVQLKHELVGSANPAQVALPEQSPDANRYARYREVLRQALNNWHDIFYLDRDDVFKHDPRGLVPAGGLKHVDPALILEVEEKNVAYFKHDPFQILSMGGISIPYYEIEAPIENPPLADLARRGLQARFTFRVKAVLDFAYLTFTPDGRPRLVAMDWKTNMLDEHSGRPALVAQEEHMVQLKHYALYLLQRYRDVFQRFEPEIRRAFGRGGREVPQLPEELTADMIFLGDVYLGGEDLSAAYRFRPVCAADLDLDAFVQSLRQRLVSKVAKFSSIEPPVSDLSRWAPVGLEAGRCGGCNQAALCPSAPGEVKSEWPASVLTMLSLLRHPKPRP